MLEVRHKLEAQGVRFRIHPTAAEIRPGIWVTGRYDGSIRNRTMREVYRSASTMSW